MYQQSEQLRLAQDQLGDSLEGLALKGGDRLEDADDRRRVHRDAEQEDELRLEGHAPTRGSFRRVCRCGGVHGARGKVRGVTIQPW